MLLLSTEKSVVALKNGLHQTVRYDTLETYQFDHSSSATPTGEEPTTFNVKSRHGAQCILEATSVDEMKDWCEKINESISKLQVRNGSSPSLVKKSNSQAANMNSRWNIS